MTNAQLQALLSHYPEDAEVFFTDIDLKYNLIFGYRETAQIKQTDDKFLMDSDKNKGFINDI